MAKARRGKNIKRDQSWRGVCPACSRTGVKLLWAKANEGGGSLKVCKRCGN